MSTGGNSEDSADVNKASYNQDACQANAINGTSVNMNVAAGAEVDHIVSNHVTPLQAPQPSRGRTRRRFFGIPKGNAPAYPNPDDYENKYPEDAYGEETGPSARVWRTYLDEAQKADGELIEGLRDTTDVLLVFAGLFSAVVATFVVQTSTALQPDYTQVTASLLLETNSILRAIVNQTSSGSIPTSPLDPASNFSTSATDRLTNGLWFASLSVSLVAAFMAVLVKQWIQHYQSVVFGTAQEQVRTRQFRFLGVERWQMPLIIGTLPMLLHLALFLYFAELLVFLIPLDGPIAYTTATIAGFAYSFYFLSTFLPLWYPMCPYKTPLSSLPAWFILSLRALSPYIMACFHKILLQMRPPNVRPIRPTSTKELSKGHTGVLYRLREAEKKAVGEIADEIDAQAFVWLYSTSSNLTVTSITIEAISGLRLDFKPSAKNILKKNGVFGRNTVACELIERFFKLNNRPYAKLEDKMLAKMERLLRAYHQLEVVLPVVVPFVARNIFAKADEPRSMVLNACLSMLNDTEESYIRKGEDPVTSLESYDYASEGPQPIMWMVLLKRNLRHSFHTPSECWSHALKVLIAFHRSRCAHHDLRLSMMLEYICSLSILASGGESQQALPDGGWEAQSALDGASFCRAKVAPKIYSALSTAIGVLRQEENSLLREFLLKPLWGILVHAHNGTRHSSSEEKERIEAAASVLRFSIQTLVESDVFWKDDVHGERTKCCSLLFEPSVWPYAMFASRILWTQELMDWLLYHCNIGLHSSYWFSFKSDELYSEFSEGTPHIYQLFLEKEGLSKIERTRHGDEFLQHYLDGLLHWKGGTSDVVRQIAYLFEPENFRRVVREYIFQHDSDGNLREPVQVQGYDPPEFPVYGVHWEPPVPGLIARLFMLCSPDQHRDSYGQYLGSLRELQLKDLGGESSSPPPAVADPERPTNNIPRGWLDGGRNPLNWIRNAVKQGDDGGAHAV